MIVAIDFDNTLVQPIEYPCTRYELAEHARDVIERLSKKGVQFVLCSARFGWYRLPMLWFIWRSGLPIKCTLFGKKPMADIYVDDRNIYCNGVNWLDVEKEIVRIFEKKNENLPCG